MTGNQGRGYLATPSSCNGNPVLVLHAWWGLNDTIRNFCDKLADSGFTAYAPDLYHGKIARTISEAEVLGRAMDTNPDKAKAAVAKGAKFLLEKSTGTEKKLAVIGFSLGAYFALELAAALPEYVKYVVLFYGTGPVDLSKSQASFLGHFAENDEYEPASNVEKLEEYLRRLGRPVTFHRYPGTGHWFFEPDRPQNYDSTAAELAWKRTLAFIETVLS
jgi:carboxymethylenebutenolidase